MLILHDKIKVIIAGTITSTIKSLYPEQILSTEQIYSMLGEAPNLSMGHMAFPCFSLAKSLKNAPPKIAAELLAAIQPNLPPALEKAVVAGPYLNFFIKNTGFGEQALNEILNGQFFTRKLTKETPKTMIEYSQPNTHKEMHVGHMRNLCLGDALIRLHRYAGYDIVASTFPGDVGTHVAKCLWYLKNHNKESVPATHKGAWLGKMYSTANNLLDDQRGTPQEENNREQLTIILKQLEKKSGEYYDLWKETREWSIELMKKTYEWAGVVFDVWYWESEVDADSLKLIQEYYQKGLFVKSEGAIGADLSEHNLGFCLLIKRDGNGLYATKDIELARRKFQEHKIERSVYIVDKRQALHFQQVFKCLELMGFENAKNCYHLQYDFVELPDGPMSSRKGNIVPLEELIVKMEEMIKTDYLAKYADTWSAEEMHTTADQIAKGAIKYGMIRMDNNRKIVFDMKEWLKLDGESGPYIQYAYTRINSMTEKLGYSEKAVDWSVLIHPLELQLMLKLSSFNDVALTAAEQYKTSFMCSYLYDLAKMFNSFYAECSVAKAETESLKDSRLALCKAVSLTLGKGLALLGIPVPKRM